jgi:outer membrane protein OmpA-like peptidoglycan-associated protein
MKTTLILSAAVLVLGGAAFLVFRGGHIGPKTPVAANPPSTSAKPALAATKPAQTPDPEPPKPEPEVRRALPAEPPPTAIAPPKPNFDVAAAENKSVKEEVLRRVDSIPNLSATNRDKLYHSVERARYMGKLLTIPFASGGTAVSGSDLDILKSTLDSGEVMTLRDDPTTVFVILGYADPKGDEKKNLAISQARADSVHAAMKSKANVANVMHSVAMGSSTLLDEKNLEKNRIVEVWAVRP